MKRKEERSATASKAPKKVFLPAIDEARARTEMMRDVLRSVEHTASEHTRASLHTMIALLADLIVEIQAGNDRALPCSRDTFSMLLQKFEMMVGETVTMARILEEKVGFPPTTVVCLNGRMMTLAEMAQCVQQRVQQAPQFFDGASSK